MRGLSSYFDRLPKAGRQVQNPLHLPPCARIKVFMSCSGVCTKAVSQKTHPQTSPASVACLGLQDINFEIVFKKFYVMIKQMVKMPMNRDEQEVLSAYVFAHCSQWPHWEFGSVFSLMSTAETIISAPHLLKQPDLCGVLDDQTAEIQTQFWRHYVSISTVVWGISCRREPQEILRKMRLHSENNL